MRDWRILLSVRVLSQRSPAVPRQALPAHLRHQRSEALRVRNLPAIECQFRAVAPGDQLSIRVEARADDKYQTMMIPVRIHPVPRIED